MIPPRRIQINRGPMPGHGRSRLLAFLRLKGPRSQLRQMSVFIERMLLPWYRARQSFGALDLEIGQPQRLSRKGTVVVAAHYGDHPIVGDFLAHHRGLGVREFVFLDLSLEGGLARHLAGETGCAVWRPRDVTPGVEVVSWLNGLRDRYASGRWCLSLDTGDAFVFYRCESRRLGDFTEFLESESRDHVYALVIDLYGDEPAARLNTKPEGGAGFQTLRHFDPFGFVTLEPGRSRSVIVRGGPQRRILFKSRPRQSPALNRISLVKWSWYYSYVAGTRLIMPAHLNNPHAPWHSSPTACILRYALLQSPETLQNAAAWEAAQVVMKDGGLAAYPGLPRLRDVALKEASSRTYRDSRDLVEAGLLNPGQWF